MNKLCKLCNSSLNLEDFEPNTDIYRIMEKENLCFQCAFWTWRSREDEYLKSLYENKEKFLSKLREENTSLYPTFNLDESDEELLSVYSRWHFGRPIIIKNEHWILHPGYGLGINFIHNKYNSILLDDGTIIPIFMKTNHMGGLTHQGNIPERFMDYPSILDHIFVDKSVSLENNQHENLFSPNAIYLTQEDEKYLKSLNDINCNNKPYYFTEGLVPKKFVKKLFEKFYN